MDIRNYIKRTRSGSISWKKTAKNIFEELQKFEKEIKYVENENSTKGLLDFIGGNSLALEEMIYSLNKEELKDLTAFIFNNTADLNLGVILRVCGDYIDFDYGRNVKFENWKKK